MMTKSDTIEAILVLNRTATRTFLAEFSNVELTEYLQRLSERSARQASSTTACTSDTDSSPLVMAPADRDV